MDRYKAIVLAAVGPGSSPASDGLYSMSIPLSLPTVPCVSLTVPSIKAYKSPTK